MILYTNKDDKISCIKTKPPKIYSKRTYWDSFEVNVDNHKVFFHFTVNSNRSYFYFCLQNQWYKTNMVSDNGFDLFDYFENRERDLSVNNSHHIME